jgi:hypothetical protein
MPFSFKIHSSKILSKVTTRRLALFALILAQFFLNPKSKVYEKNKNHFDFFSFFIILGFCP